MTKSRSAPASETFMPTLHSRGQRPEAKPMLGGQVELLPLDRIEPNCDNPRGELADDDPELQSLATSLADHRLLQPIAVVRAGGDDERFTIIAGERRWHAARLAGWTVIPAFILNVAPEAAAELLVVENLDRQDFNPIQVGRAVALLMRPVAEGGPGWSTTRVAARFGHKRVWALQAAKLLALPLDWQRLIETGELDASTGAKIAEYAERPEVLGALAADRQANPSDWANRVARIASIDRVVRAIDGVSAFREGIGRPRSSPRQLAGDERDVLPLARRSAPVDHEIADVGSLAPETAQDRSEAPTSKDTRSASIVDSGPTGEPDFRPEPPDVAPELTTDGRRELLRQILELTLDLDLPGVDRLQEALASRRRQLLDLALPQRVKPRRPTPEPTRRPARSAG